MKNSQRSPVDRLYQDKRQKIADFVFDESVVEVFDDMISRSVPGYELVVELISVIAREKEKSGGRSLACYDLGCSRGAATQSILGQLKQKSSSVIAVDNSPAMLKVAQINVSDERAVFIQEDVGTMNFEPADLFVMNLILQFIEDHSRLNLLTRIKQALKVDGVLILTEKVRTDDEDIAIHEQFKRSKGYSELEIQQKRQALERVMKIDSIETHTERLKQAGFKDVKIWFRLLNWVSFIAH